MGGHGKTVCCLKSPYSFLGLAYDPSHHYFFMNVGCESFDTTQRYLDRELKDKPWFVHRKVFDLLEGTKELENWLRSIGVDVDKAFKLFRQKLEAD